jgi:hypothetical protein
MGAIQGYHEPYTVTALIASGQSLSGVIDFNDPDVRPCGLLMPAAWTAAGLTFQGSIDGSTFGNIYLSSGAEYAVTADASLFIPLDSTQFAAAQFLKIRSGTNSVPVTQGANRTITVITTGVNQYGIVATWNISSASASLNATTGPTGSSDATKITEWAATAQHYVQKSLARYVRKDRRYQFSVFAKAAERSKLGLAFSIGNAAFVAGYNQAWFDLSTGTIGGIHPGVTADITPFGSNWYLCSISAAARASNISAVSCHILSAGGFYESYTGDGSSGLYVWQPKVVEV